RVAATWAGSDVEVRCQRPGDAGHGHAHRVGRAVEALGATGRDRLDGVVISQAMPRDALELVRRHTEATRLKGYGAAERWRAYKGQPAAALRCTWAKHPAVL